MTASQDKPTPTPRMPDEPLQHRADLVREFLMHQKFYVAHDIRQDPAYDLVMPEVRHRWLPFLLSQLNDNDVMALYRAVWPLTQRAYTEDPDEFFEILEKCELDWQGV